MAQYGSSYPGGPPAQGAYPGAPPGQAGYPGAPPGQGGYGPPSYGQPGYQTPATVDPNLYQWFQAVDRDRTGRINTVELQQALNSSGWNQFKLDTCQLMIGMFDHDRSGQIDINEFQALWTYMNQCKAAFEQFDRDRSMSIDANELNNVYTHMGYRVSPQFSQRVVYRYDTNGQRRLDFDSFIHSCIVLKSSTDVFRKKDFQQSGVIQISYEDYVTSVVAINI